MMMTGFTGLQFIVIAIITGGDAMSHLVQVGLRMWRQRTC